MALRTGFRGQGSGGRVQGSGIRDLGSGIWDQGFGIRDLGSGIWIVGCCYALLTLPVLRPLPASHSVRPYSAVVCYIGCGGQAVVCYGGGLSDPAE